MPRRPNRRTIPLNLLVDIWTAYIRFRRPQVRPSTSDYDYVKITRRLERLYNEAPQLRDSVKIREWLMEHYSPETTRRTIQQFNAACSWAAQTGRLDRNPFEGLGRGLRTPAPRDTNWAAFTLEERDRIILAFEDQAPYYAPWVKFLFWTGCRPEEAAGLTWAQVSPDCREILICEALPMGQSITQPTKTGWSTRFPCNNRLSHLLSQQRHKCPAGDQSWVFPGVEGGRMHYQNFQRRHWRPIVLDLVERGQVAFYLSQYHCRHTWITGALAAGMDVQDVSYLARVSTQVIYRHYAARARRIFIPEF